MACHTFSIPFTIFLISLLLNPLLHLRRPNSYCSTVEATPNFVYNIYNGDLYNRVFGSPSPPATSSLLCSAENYLGVEQLHDEGFPPDCDDQQPPVNDNLTRRTFFWRVSPRSDFVTTQRESYILGLPSLQYGSVLFACNDEQQSKYQPFSCQQAKDAFEQADIFVPSLVPVDSPQEMKENSLCARLPLNRTNEATMAASLLAQIDAVWSNLLSNLSTKAADTVLDNGQQQALQMLQNISWQDKSPVWIEEQICRMLDLLVKLSSADVAPLPPPSPPAAAANASHFVRVDMTKFLAQRAAKLGKKMASTETFYERCKFHYHVFAAAVQITKLGNMLNESFWNANINTTLPTAKHEMIAEQQSEYMAAFACRNTRRGLLLHHCMEDAWSAVSGASIELASENALAKCGPHAWNERSERITERIDYMLRSRHDKSLFFAIEFELLLHEEAGDGGGMDGSDDDRFRSVVERLRQEGYRVEEVERNS